MLAVESLLEMGVKSPEDVEVINVTNEGDMEDVEGD